MTHSPSHASAPRFPAEWEPHAATWLAWPHNEEDWPGKFGPIEWVFTEIVRGVVGSNPSPRERGEDVAPSEGRQERGLPAGRERLELLCHSDAILARARDCLAKSHVNLDLVRFHPCPTDRGWMRDCGPTFVARAASLEALDWKFNAWAKYDNWRLDDAVPRLVESVTSIPRSAPARLDDPAQRIILEGGAIEPDGAGTLLVTEECLLDNTTQVRNPGLTREGYERAFGQYLGIQKTVWLPSGCVGDDTHGHIDDVARFAPPPRDRREGPTRILLAFEDDPRDENHRSSLENEAVLRDARDARGRSFDIVRLPYPDPVLFDGQRLPASYANFYTCNRATLVPIFGCAKDAAALDTIARCYPDRPVVPIYARDLVWGLGTIHCLTQQQPAPPR